MSERKEGRGKGKGKKKDRGSGKKPAPAPDVQSPGECAALGLRCPPARVRRFSFARPRPALGMPGPAPGRPRGRTVLALRGDALYLGAQPHPGARTPRAVHGGRSPGPHSPRVRDEQSSKVWLFTSTSAERPGAER